MPKLQVRLDGGINFFDMFHLDVKFNFNETWAEGSITREFGVGSVLFAFAFNHKNPLVTIL